MRVLLTSNASYDPPRAGRLAVISSGCSISPSQDMSAGLSVRRMEMLRMRTRTIQAGLDIYAVQRSEPPDRDSVRPHP